MATDTRVTVKQTKAYLVRNDGALLFRTMLPANYTIAGHQDGKYFVCDVASLWVKDGWVVLYADTAAVDVTDPGTDPGTPPEPEPAEFEIIDATIRYRDTPDGEVKSVTMVVQEVVDVA